MKTYNQFIEENYKYLKNYVLNNWRNTPYVEDVLQETFIDFGRLNYFEKYDSTKSSLLTYFINYLNYNLLQTIGKNKKEIRRKQKVYKDKIKEKVNDD